MKELIVVPPRFFDVVDSYNTRMRPDHPYGRPDHIRTAKQWHRMVKVIEGSLALEVIWGIEPMPGLADMAFACDPGFWIEDLFVASNFWPPPGMGVASPRQHEVEVFKHWFRENGMRVAILPRHALFEGGDCVLAGKVLFIGYGRNRTNIWGAREVEKILYPFGIKVCPIRRVTEEFYHLNSVFTHYPSVDLIAYYPPAFETAAGDIVKKKLPSSRVYGLSDEEAMRVHPDFGGEYLYSYTLNSIENNGKVLMPYCAPRFGEFLEKSGLWAIVPEDGSSEFERSGGSYRCLTMFHNVTA